MLTYHEQAKIDNNELVVGVIKSVTALNQMETMIPSKGIDSAVHTYTRFKKDFNQRSLVGTYNTSGAIITNASQPFERLNTELTSIIGQIEINQLIIDQEGSYNGALASQMAGTTAGMAKEYQAQFMDGQASFGYIGGNIASTNPTVAAVDGTTFTTDLLSILSSVLDPLDYARVNTQAKRAASVEGLTVGNDTKGHESFTGTITFGTGTDEQLTPNGAKVLEAATSALHGLKGFKGINAFLDGSDNDMRKDDGLTGRATSGEELLQRLDTFSNRVTAKGGAVDFITMNGRGINRFTSALRETSYPDSLQKISMAGGLPMSINTYRGIPIFMNNYIGHTISDNLDVGLSAGNLGYHASQPDDVYLGTFDDGSKNGICGLHGKKDMGITLKDLGDSHTKDTQMHRLIMRRGLVSYTELGLVRGLI